jgi:hypothetical protein
MTKPTRKRFRPKVHSSKIKVVIVVVVVVVIIVITDLIF